MKIKISLINTQSQENVVEPKLVLTSLQVPQFPQRGDLEEHRVTAHLVSPALRQRYTLPLVQRQPSHNE